MTEHLINKKQMPRTEEQFKEMRDKTRAAIIDAALRLFAYKGYHGTSIADIAKEAGISKGLAYNYFESKQKLAENIIEKMVEVGRDIEESIETSDDAYEQLRLIIINAFDYIKKNEKYWRLYVSFALQPEVFGSITDITYEFNEKSVEKIAKIFERIGVKNPEVEAKIFEALYDGVVLHYYFNKKNYPFEKCKEAILERYNKERLECLKL